VVEPGSTRARAALALAVLGGAALVASASHAWVEPSRVAWPSYTDGVPDWISRPSDASFRLGALALGLGALVLVALARRGVARGLPWIMLALVGLGAVALGVGAFAAVAGHRGFGSLVANDMTLAGFRHGALNYVELAGAALLCLSPLAVVRGPAAAIASSPTAPSSAAGRGGLAGTGPRRRRRPGGDRTSTSGS
jgi:hypothetical protein